LERRIYDICTPAEAEIAISYQLSAVSYRSFLQHQWLKFRCSGRVCYGLSVAEPERRSAPRAAIELSVEYKRLNTFFADYTRNISKGGTFIRTERPLDVGTEFVFALSIRSLEEPLRLQGRVKWIVPSADATADSPAGMGIEFMYVDDAERHATEKVVEDLMKRELGDELSSKLLGRKVHE